MSKVETDLVSSQEAQVISLISDGKKSFEEMKEIFPFGEKQLYKTIEVLISKNIIKFDTKTKVCEFDTEIVGERVVLDGNILLPMSIIKMPHRNSMMITRGTWYEFEYDFDIRRIIWNVRLFPLSKDPQQSNQTLVDLIKSTVLKERKTKTIQEEQYKQLVNKLVPYSDNIVLQLKVIGEEVTDVNIIFRHYIGENDIKYEYRGFMVSSSISTVELISSLKIPSKDRDFTKLIHINRIFKLSDFIFSNNEIPISLQDNSLIVMRLTNIKKKFKLDYFKIGITGERKAFKSDEYEIEDGIKVIRENFEGYTLSYLNSLNFEVDTLE
jgi:hypothetical protein